MNTEWLSLFGYNLALSVIMSWVLSLTGAQGVSSKKSGKILAIIQGAALGGLLVVAFASEHAAEQMNLSFLGAFAGAIVAAGVASWLVRFQTESTGLYLSLYALGMAMMSSLVALSPHLESHFSSRIFGDIAWLTQQQCLILSGVFIVLLVVVLLNWRAWSRHSFNHSVLELSTKCSAKSWKLSAVTIVALALSAQAVGILFSLGCFFIPTVFARNKHDSFWKHTIKISLASTVGAFAGFFFSMQHPELPTTGAIILAISLLSALLAIA